jgi:hypothetical protein
MTDIPPIGEELSPASFIGSMIASGLSPTQGLSQWRELGGSLRTQTWYELWGEVRGAIANREDLQAITADALPPGELLNDWAAGQEGQYATFVQTFIRQGGEQVLESRYFTYITEGAHTPSEALAAADDYLTQGARTGTGKQGEVVLGSVITSMNRMTGR